MLRRVSGLALFATGCAAGLALAALVAGDTGMKAVAQPASADESHGHELGHGTATATSDGVAVGVKYQISSWGSSGNHGAYLIDTQTGEVWSVESTGRMRSHGRPVSKDAN
jgi:hypothetical protein